MDAVSSRDVPVTSRSGLTYYLQGECLKAFAEESWNLDAAAARLAGTPGLVAVARRKVKRFLDTALQSLRKGGPTSELRRRALAKSFAKLPHLYHGYLDHLAAEFDRGRWKS
jgi:hypothetical protein